MVTTGRAATTIFYPETDGLPMPDGFYQDPIFRRAVDALEFHFSGVPDAVVSGNTFIYYVEDNANRRVSPDCYVAFDLSDAALESLSVRENNAYLLWEVGKPPDFVLEIGSPSTGHRDQTTKRDIYADMGVGEYWRFDGTGGDFYREPLVGERLVGGEYERMDMRQEPDGSVWGHSDALNLDLWWTDGELRYWDPAQARWLRNTLKESEEAVQAAEARASTERDARLAEAVRADAERDARLAEAVRADAERDARLAADARATEADARADAADARAARLEAELRRLRGE